ncbi:mechanosensitive ion channel family protein [Methanocella sp. CWC-04]|uniref:Mechanosensitive ion channel family protein n=1 Tax=Methanooceanicella nereidis TaxID=2052831 RepID=A0AAP2W6T0_9EURY|nr:mechanosensitive ion channel family protein [Methanocella sp. CWC-04]
MADLMAALLIVAIFLILSEIVKRIVLDVAPHLVSKTKSTLDDEILSVIKGPIQVIVIVAGIYLAFKTINHMPVNAITMLDRLSAIVLILLCAYVVSNLIKGIIKWYVTDVAPKTNSDLDDHLMPFLRKFLVVLVYSIAVIMIIGQFGVEITPLIASLGVVGIAVALAAKESLSNLFGAVAILTDRPYKVGDRLILPSIGQGDVLDVGLRSTRIRTMDNRVVIVPNEEMARSKIVNMSQPSSKVRVTIKVGISYRSDVDKACAIMERIASELPQVSKEPGPRAYVSALGDFSVDITMLVWIDSYREDLSVPDVIYRKVLARFKEEGIEIPYPIKTVIPK